MLEGARMIVEAEPVAWRVRCDHDHWMLFRNKAEAEVYAGPARALVQPLYAQAEQSAR